MPKKTVIATRLAQLVARNTDDQIVEERPHHAGGQIVRISIVTGRSEERIAEGSVFANQRFARLLKKRG